MCLNKTYGQDLKGKYVSDAFPDQNSLKQDALLPLILNFVLEYVITKIQENQVGMNLNETYQLLGYDDNVSLLGKDTTTM
jgi:hypothetical protein